MEKILNQLESEIKSLFISDRSGHDLYHLKRVMNIALHIQEIEGGDRFVIAVSALLHDLHRIIQVQTGKFCSPAASLPRISVILDNIALSEDKKNNILHCIEYHEEYNFSEQGKTVTDIETLILQDADNLDALGAIGVARTFSFGATHGVPMWIPEKPFDRQFYDESVKDPSVIHHFHSKLLKLKDNMNTETGKKMAFKRHAFMEAFVDEFMAEWEGEK